MKKNRVFIVVFGLLCVVIFLTVGYSAFLDDLSIASSTARAREYRDIMVTGVTSSTSGATVTNLDYDPDSIFNEATLSQNGTITYTVTVKNLGEDPMAIYSIDTSGLPSDLRIVSTSGYDFTNKEKICDDDNSSLCTLNATRTITIVIGYNNYVSDSTVYNINIGFEFVKIYDVTYNNITVGNNYPTHAYYGKTFTVTFQNDIPYAVELSQNFQKTYSNNTLTVQNPTSGFAINRYYHITYNLDGGTQAANQPDRYLAGNSVTLLDPTKTDYTFGGWYDNSSFTGSAITSTNGRSGDLVLYAKWTSSGSGGGMGTPENPYEDTTTQTYDPHNVPANSTIIYTAVTGEPQVSTDADGNITSFEFTNTGTDGISTGSGIDTGILAFDGGGFEVTLKAKYTFANLPTSGMAPVIDLSENENGLNGIIVGTSTLSSGTAYNETGSSFKAVTNNKGQKFRINKYTNGSINSGIDYYHKQATSYYSYTFGTQSTTFILTLKLHYNNSKVTSELYYNDDYNTPLAKLKYSSKNQSTDTYIEYTGTSDNITIELGKWKNTSGTTITYQFDVIEFSAEKT